MQLQEAQNILGSLEMHQVSSKRWSWGGLTAPPALADYSQDEKALLGACDCSQGECGTWGPHTPSPGLSPTPPPSPQPGKCPAEAKIIKLFQLETVL